MFQKVIISGGIIEVKEYERLNTAMADRDDVPKANAGESVNNAENYRRRNQIRRDAIRHLVCQNFDNRSKFITLTFRDTDAFDIKDPIACNQEYLNFVRRIKYKYGRKLKYVSVIEFQDKNDRGAVHYHCFFDLPFIPISELEELWGLGYVYINAIDKVDNLGAYVIKYMTQDTDDPRLKGIKAYNCSIGLKRPEILCSWKDGHKKKIDQIIIDLKDRRAVYSAKYNSETAGEILYLQYNSNRK